MVCGSSEAGFPQTDPLPTDISGKSKSSLLVLKKGDPNDDDLTCPVAVSAILLMGDPSHISSAPYNRGTSTKNGVSDVFSQIKLEAQQVLIVLSVVPPTKSRRLCGSAVENGVVLRYRRQVL